MIHFDAISVDGQDAIPVMEVTSHAYDPGPLPIGMNLGPPILSHVEVQFRGDKMWKGRVPVVCYRDGQPEFEGWGLVGRVDGNPRDGYVHTVTIRGAELEADDV